MLIPFYKYQGTGNDFILIDNRTLQLNLSVQTIAHWCDRRFGIGADGLILIDNHNDYDFSMVYFNSDGSQSMCGNGSRCAVHFAHSLGLAKENTTFLSTDGIHIANIYNEIVRLSIHDVKNILNVNNGMFVNTGSPHHISLVESVDEVDVYQEGKAIRYSAEYSPNGTNVNFVELSRNKIKIRTYERGVEGETLSCGTGVTAAAIIANLYGYSSPVHIETRGGDLQVEFEKEDNIYKNVFLIGPAVKVFEGTIQYNTKY